MYIYTLLLVFLHKIFKQKPRGLRVAKTLIRQTPVETPCAEGLNLTVLSALFSSLSCDIQDDGVKKLRRRFV